MPANQTHDREAARTRIFDGAQTLAAALMKCDRSERWEPLRDLILAGLGPSVGVERKRVVPVPLLPEDLAWPSASAWSFTSCATPAPRC